jgi:hypothetical protein
MNRQSPNGHEIAEEPRMTTGRRDFLKLAGTVAALV